MTSAAGVLRGEELFPGTLPPSSSSSTTPHLFPVLSSLSPLLSCLPSCSTNVHPSFSLLPQFLLSPSSFFVHFFSCFSLCSYLSFVTRQSSLSFSPYHLSHPAPHLTICLTQHFTSSSVPPASSPPPPSSPSSQSLTHSFYFLLLCLNHPNVRNIFIPLLSLSSCVHSCCFLCGVRRFLLPGCSWPGGQCQGFTLAPSTHWPVPGVTLVYPYPRECHGTPLP